MSRSAESREHWATKLGIILAVSGSAIGLGNFLRFPAKAVAFGGGAFMIPYFVSLILMGIPLMWVEWTLGRFGGKIGHGSAPAIFSHLSNKKWLRYAGVLGILGPVLIFSYYTYIESWTLAYSFYSLTGKITFINDTATMQSFLKGFQGLEHNEHFNGLGRAYTFFLITFLINSATLYYGIKGGIERFCKWAMPVLFICAVALFFRILTLDSVHAPQFHWNVNDGFGYFWNPHFESLLSARVWLEAAGQIFFTLSIGTGAIITYASYLKKNQDVVLSGLTSVSFNEVAEVILGGSILIPAAFVLFGPQEIQTVVAEGIFNLGFVTMPLVLNQLPWPALLGFLWYFLLFLAAVTSSVSLAQPFIAFLEDEFDCSRKKAVAIFSMAMFVLCQPAIFFLKNGAIDEIDFWGGSFCLVVFATIEIILFSWILGIDKAWKELHEFADIKVPAFYKFIMKYVTPLFLLTILGTWLWQEWIPNFLFERVDEANRSTILGIRIGIILLFFTLLLLTALARKREGEIKP